MPTPALVRCAFLTLAILVTLAPAVLAQGPIFVVRHAERADSGAGAPTMNVDPNLSEAGRRRAESLATMLRDAGITAIYVTEFKRTQETAAPLAARLGLTPVRVSAKDMPALIARLRERQGAALVVGHSNTVPAIVEALTSTPAITIADDEYDNLFVVAGEKPALVRLRFP